MKNNTPFALYFVENLTLISSLFYVLPHLIRKRSSGEPRKSKVYFIDGSKCGILIARLTSWITNAEPEQLAFRLIDIRDDSGALLRLRIAHRDLAEVQEKIIATPLFQDVLQDEAVKNRMPTFLAKQIASPGPRNSSDRTIWHAISLIQIAVWKVKHDGVGGADTIFFMGRRPWPQEIEWYASRYDVQIVPVEREYILDVRMILRKAKALLPQPVKSKIKGLIALYIAFRKAGLKGLRKQFASLASRSANLSQRSSPKLAVQYYGHLNLNRPELHSDLFFWQQSQLSGRDILLTFGISRDPVDEAKWSEITEHGMTPVALSPMCTTIPSAPIFHHSPRTQKVNPSGRKLKNWHDSLESRLLLQQVSSYYRAYDYWTDFFERCNVKLYVSWYKYDATHCVIADALQSLGGITAIYQRALEEFPSPETTIATDIVFGFSQGGSDIEQRQHSVIPYYVITGYIGDHRFPLLREHAQAVRRKLQQHGASRVLAIFDENSLDDSRWHTGHELQRDNYLFWLEKVLSEPWLGLVLKPKVPSTLRRRLGEVADLLKRAEETGRCFVFEGGTLHGSYPPAVAALASDVAIHGHLCAATAGFEAALAGVPTLLMDREGWPVSKLCRLGKRRVVFTEWQDVWAACQDHWNAPLGMPGFGDWSPMLNELDPFRDGRAAERMGTYLKWLLDGLQSGRPRDIVMADAAERYCKTWGQDKVTEIRANCYSILESG